MSEFSEKKTVAEMPDNFKNIMIDFTNDLTLTFPEYSSLWKQWTLTDTPKDDFNQLFEYSITVFPERFFDILYQNEDIFSSESNINTCFLPNVDFKLLFNCQNISEKTQNTMWKYLQLILFTVLSSIQNKNNFGETMNLFDGIDENDLQSKLQETIESMTGFFSNMDHFPSNDDNMEEDPQTKNENENDKSFFDIPNPEEIHEHLKGLFDGKIGKLAKELAEEIANDMSNFMDDEDTRSIKTTQDMLKLLLKNPKKMMDMVKTVGNKLNAKMESGEITQEELMKEAGDIFGKMKHMGGGQEQFNEMFKNLAKHMGGGIGKNSKLNMNAMSQLMKINTRKEKMKDRLNQRKQSVSSQEVDKNYTIEQKDDNTYLFKMKNDQNSPNYSFVNEKEQIDQIMKDLKFENEEAKCSSNTDNSCKKKSSKKKGNK